MPEGETLSSRLQEVCAVGKPFLAVLRGRGDKSPHRHPPGRSVGHPDGACQTGANLPNELVAVRLFHWHFPGNYKTKRTIRNISGKIRNISREIDGNIFSQ
jgi:hypothetical protein